MNHYPFIGYSNFSGLVAKIPPARVYAHRGGFVESYGEDHVSEKVFSNFTKLKLTALEELVRGRNYQYLLGIMWGHNQDRMIDIFAFSGISDWPGNPDVNSWVMRNGVLSKDTTITCGDSLILLGREELYRRTKNSLEDYLANPPGLDYINQDLNHQ